MSRFDFSKFVKEIVDDVKAEVTGDYETKMLAAANEARDKLVQELNQMTFTITRDDDGNNKVTMALVFDGAPKDVLDLFKSRYETLIDQQLKD